MLHRFATLLTLFAIMLVAQAAVHANPAASPRPVNAQDEAPDALGEQARRLVGTWIGVKMEGEAIEEGAFNLTFAADGTGDVAGEAVYWSFNEEMRVCSVMRADDQRLLLYRFTVSMSADGQTATFNMDNDARSQLTVRRAAEAEEE